MMKTACCIFSYGITKGMKSFGPIGLLKKNQHSKELILQQIEYLRQIFGAIDIYIVVGFGEEKIYKRVCGKKYIKIISNQEYSNKNYGHAIKMFVDSISNTLSNYHGIFFMDSNILIKNLLTKKKNQSWIVTQKNRNNKTSYKTDFLGLSVDDNERLRYLFYNMGDISWCKSFYLTQEHIRSMIQYRSIYHDNMFLFEVINTCIEKLNFKIYINSIANSKDCVEIKGIKDKYKIQ